MMNLEQIEEKTIEKTLAEPKTVIVWGQYDLLAEAVEHLLDTRNGWKVIRVSDEWDQDTLAREVERINPEALIVHEGVLSINGRTLIKFVQDRSKLKIITLSLENNSIEIYNKQTIYINAASDLLAVIDDDADPDAKGGSTEKSPTIFTSQPLSVICTDGIVKNHKGV
ncbi:MAG: hypothetical protein ABI904_06850 [Chloroflexota bacterium]